MIVGIIPARIGSKRFPKKILADIDGKPMVVHVAERAMQSKLLEKVILAIDSNEAKQVLSDFNLEITYTGADGSIKKDLYYCRDCKTEMHIPSVAKFTGKSLGQIWLRICLFIFLPPSTLGSIFFGASFGILWLSTVPATSGIVAHIFGTKYLGLLYGLVFLSHQIGSFFGAYLGGLFYDLYGSYDYAWYLAIALSIFAGLIHLPIKEQAIERLQKA